MYVLNIWDVYRILYIQFYIRLLRLKFEVNFYLQV